MTQLEYLLSKRDWANRWMDTPASELPGTLTHEKVAQVSIDTEVELTDYMGLGLDGWVLVDPETGKVYPS